VSYGLKESGLERLISASYTLLGLMSFLTAERRRYAPGPSNRQYGRQGGGRDPLRLREEVHPRGTVNWKSLIDLNGYPGVKEKAFYDSKARSTSSRTAMYSSFATVNLQSTSGPRDPSPCVLLRSRHDDGFGRSRIGRLRRRLSLRSAGRPLLR